MDPANPADVATHWPAITGLIGAVVGGFLTGLGTLLINLRKARVEEWSVLIERLQADCVMIREQNAAQQRQMDLDREQGARDREALRNKHDECLTEAAQMRGEIRAMRLTLDILKKKNGVADDSHEDPGG